MTLQELTEVLQVQIPETVWNTYYPIAEERRHQLCTLALIDRLEQRFGLLGPYLKAVKEGFLDLEKDPARKLYLDIYSLYMRDCSLEEAKLFDYPKPNGTPGSYMLPLLVHLPSLEQTYANLTARGFTHEEAKHCLSIYRIYLWEMETHRDGFVGISGSISNWMSHSTKGQIYYPGIGGLNFQVNTIPENEPYFLRNRTTGELLPVFGNGVTFHRSGVLLGSAGAEDPRGAFTPVFSETALAYSANPVRNSRICPEPEVFPKSDWELVLQPGDWVISTHIFFGSDFTPETVDRAFAQGQRMAREYFPDYHIKAQRCSSWLMNPLINQALGEDAKLSRFSARFVRYPRLSSGKAFWSYVFPGAQTDPQSLPEASRLQKAFKQHLLSGGQIYEYSGILLF